MIRKGTPRGRSRGASTPNLPSRPLPMLGGGAPVAQTTGATVLRFERGAGKEGLKRLTTTGMRVASARELTAEGPLPEDLGGADMIYFERFGIAIVQQPPDQLRSTLVQAQADRTLANVRPERIFRALGPLNRADAASWSRTDLAADVAESSASLSADYLRGYRDAVVELVDRLLPDEEAAAPTVAAVEESEVTWGLQACRVPETRLSGRDIKVAVLDTGMDLEHEDFVGRAIVSQSFVAGEEAQDGHGHGTHCIGTAMGPLRPTSGPRYGIAYDALIHAGKVLSNAGFGSDRSIIAGMEWALEQGCSIISMSLGAAVQRGEGFIQDYEVIGDICLDDGCLVIAAAGNDSARPGFIAPVSSPANCPSLMAIAALTPRLRVATFSNGGVNPGQAVDLAAPGVDVLSSVPGGYARFDGTSMATPHVAGIAALYAEADPKFRGRALLAVLMQRARNLPRPTRDVGRGLTQAPI